MASTVQRGNYYKLRTRDMYEKAGYTTQLSEFTCGRLIGQGKMIFTKRDVFGSDGISMNGEEIIFWNSKHATTHESMQEQIRQAKKEYAKYPFPPGVKIQIVMWIPKQKPTIYHLNTV